MNIPLKWRRNGRNIAYSVFFHKLTKPYLTSLCTSPFPCKVRALTKPTLLTPILHSKLKISCLCPPFIFNTGSKPNIYYLSHWSIPYWAGPEHVIQALNWVQGYGSMKVTNQKLILTTAQFLSKPQSHP